jgi:2-polyprenyl-3-methyl-5-hydroxy-6-metoxy-1,4-benzoquinol methylase
MQELECIVCRCRKFDKFSDSSNISLPVIRCKDCGLYFADTSNVNIDEITKSLYKEQYWNTNDSEESLSSDFHNETSRQKLKHLASQTKYCKEFLTGKHTLLEIGPGAGQALVAFEKMGYLVTGVEPDERNVSIINEKLSNGSCYQGYLGETVIKGNFDVIWMSHVLEHLARPDLALQIIKHNMSDETVLFIEVPDCANPRMLKQSVFKNPHLYHFNKKNLHNFLFRLGFQILKYDSFRIPSLPEAGFRKILAKIGLIKWYEPQPYYPRIITYGNNGQLIRFVCKK